MLTASINTEMNKLKFTIFTLIVVGILVPLVVFCSNPRGIVPGVSVLSEEKGETTKQRLADENLPKTHTVMSFRPFPRNRTAVKEMVQEAFTKTYGSMNASTVYVHRHGRLGNNIIQLSNAVYFAELMNTSTIYIDPGFCRINNSVEIKARTLPLSQQRRYLKVCLF